MVVAEVGEGEGRKMSRTSYFPEALGVGRRSGGFGLLEETPGRRGTGTGIWRSDGRRITILHRVQTRFLEGELVGCFKINFTHFSVDLISPQFQFSS